MSAHNDTGADSGGGRPFADYVAVADDQVRLIEMTLQHHLGCSHPDGWTLCLCCKTFEGPVFHRRHVASLIAAGEMCEPECRHPLHGGDDER